MDNEVIDNLQKHIVNVPGGRDKEDCSIITVHIPQQSNNLQISSSLKYVISIFSAESKHGGFTVILDARKCPWRVARSCIRQVNVTFEPDKLSQFIVLRPDAFWDKQRVESCRRAQKDGQVIFVPITRLFKYVDQAQLPIELSGNFIFNMDQWFENRTKVEEFYEESETCSRDLQDVQANISNMYTLSASQIQNNHQLILERLDVLKIVSNNCIEKGSALIQKIEYDNRNRKFASESDSMSTPQDITDTIDKIEIMVGSLRKKLIDLETVKKSMRKSFVDTKDLAFLEEGVAHVVNWILGPAEDLFKKNLKVGYDLASAEELRHGHERIELQCWNAYGAYAELVHKIELFAGETLLTQQQKDLISQKDFMDFVCRSFANRLERRRNILITSLRFFRLVSEYFDKTGQVFDSVVMGNSANHFQCAEFQLKSLQDSQVTLDAVEKELFKEGEKLSDILSMPLKDAFGREIVSDYSDDISNIRDILDATTARKNILADSVELQKLTLEQVTFIYQYESDAMQAIHWLDELFLGLLRYHGHVGCTVYEIQAQKGQHQVYLETAKCAYNYGLELINAAAALRDSCKLDRQDNTHLAKNLKHSWDNFMTISQEQMTRLRVCAVFHRSVEEQCNQMRDLREAIATISLMDISKRSLRVQHYFAVRERLLVDVGRMVRLGRLLRTRLKEPLYSDDGMSESTSAELEKIEIVEPLENETAVEAIGEKLVEITELAEELDQTLKSAQQDSIVSTSATRSLPIPIVKKFYGNGYPLEEPSSLRPDDGKSDDEFLTASDCTLHHSRSSSYNTASDSEQLMAHWWEYGKDDMHDDIAKEKMVLAVGITDLPLAKSVLKPSPEVPRGKIAREVTETTHIKVQHSHAFDVKSFVLTSETVRNTKDTFQQGGVTNETENETIAKIDGHEPKESDFLNKLQECGDWMQLKILEVTPELTTLGSTLEDALQLQQAHNEVLLQLQSKQSPVEELLRQADQLIATQKPRAEVYAAMAESLGKAWNDINAHLENRKIILDLNVRYHTRANEFFDSMNALEAACSDTVVPIEIDAVKNMLSNIHELRRTVLESLMGAMQAGNMIIGNLKELEAEGTLDSRPDRIRISAKKALTQVQEWMERLHYKRKVLETIFTQRKLQLEQCLALAMLSADLHELQTIIHHRRDMLHASDQLGDSSSSAELLQHECKKLIPEAQLLQEKALKITKTTEHLLQSGCLAGEQATKNAYDVLSGTSDYLNDLQQRDALFEKVIDLFKSAQTVFNKLDQLDVQLKATELPTTSPQLTQLHAHYSDSVEPLTTNLISDGHALLENTGSKLNACGIRSVVEELERRKIYFDGLCMAHKEENRKINQALITFLDQQEGLLDWLVKVADSFLREHVDLGSNLVHAKDFLNLHNQLLTDLQTKGNEINALLLTLPPILEYLEDHQRLQVDEKVEALHERWISLKNILESRLDLAVLFIKFHSEADKVTKEMDAVENVIAQSEDLPDEVVKGLEDKVESLIPLYQSAKNTGLTFIEEAKKVTEPHLNIRSACGCVESVLDDLSSRQITLNRNWQTVCTKIVEKRQVEVLIENNMMESKETINWISKLDSQLYPVITTNETDPKIVAQHIENKLNDVLTQITRAQYEVAERLQVADSLMMRLPHDQTKQIKQKLIDMTEKLGEICSEYQSLLHMMVSYFRNIDQIDVNVADYFGRFDNDSLPNNSTDVDLLLREVENKKQSIQNQFTMADKEKKSIIDKISVQEPKDIVHHDVEKLHYLLQIRDEEFTNGYKQTKDNLESHQKLCLFDNDLQQINTTLDDLNEKLTTVKGQYGPSLAVAQDTSQSFIYFEKTVEILEPKIVNFIDTGRNLIQDHTPPQTQHVQQQINNLVQRWDALKQQIHATRNLIDLSVKYFTLIEEANEWFQEGNTLLVAIAAKSATVKHFEEAQLLLNEIEIFLKPGESKQSQRIQKISEIGVQLFGQLPQVTGYENRDMLELFNTIILELNTLAENIKQAEDARVKAAYTIQVPIDVEVVAPATETLLSEDTHPHIEGIGEIPSESPVLPKMEAPVFTSSLNDQLIQEGSTFTFVCRVSGEPIPVVTWHKDGISIQNNPDYQTTFDQGLCTLTIEETFAEDSARYICKAINAAGSAETEAHLVVKENAPEEQLIPPHFTRELVPGMGRESEPFEFVCKVEGNPLPTVQWYKHLNCIDNSPYYLITYNNGEARLKLNNVHLDDRADYTCKAFNEVGIAQSTANLNVMSLELTKTPAFVTPLSNIMARAGQKIKLECEITGLPTPKLSWSHNGKPLSETRELKLHRDGQKATLIIHEAFPKDAGTYTATASNLVGEVSSACTITVKGRLPPETSDSELASDMEPVKPSIHVPLKDLSINEGNRVRLDCVIVGQPEPEVIWYHDDRPVQESPDFQLLFQGDRCSLVIKEALMEDAGEYKVVALNSAGEASSKACLSVTPNVDKSKMPDDKIETVGSAPKFSKLLSDILVSEGDAVILEATVSGDPNPDIKWLLNNAPINADEHTNIEHDEDGNLKLRIDHVQPEDRGVYTVKASNSAGEAKCFAQLIVKTLRSTTEATKVHEATKVAPVFKETFTDQTAIEGTPIKFECIVTGKPTPKVRWLFNEASISGKDFLISTSGNRQVLSIPEASTNHRGIITCIAENDAGQATCVANLIVETVQHITLPEMEKSVTDLTVVPAPDWGKQIEQQSESTFTLKREVNVQSSSSTTSKIISSTTGMEPHTEKHKYASQDEKYFKQINLEAPEIKESHKQEEYHQVGNQAPVIHEKSSTVNIVPAIESTIPKSIYKARPPKFVSPVIGKIVDQDSYVVLEGILDASPTPAVTWTKNGVELKTANNASVTFKHNCARVELTQVGIIDAGRYTCTAVNEAGKAISTADLVIRKTIFPPVFGRRLQAQVIKKGERAIMEVEVTGTPDPEITWFKDGSPMNLGDGSDYKLIAQGNCQRVIIEKADVKHTGKYTVCAVNPGGEAQSIADIAVFEPTPESMVEVVKTVVFEDVRKHEIMSSEASKGLEKTTGSSDIQKPIPIPDIFKPVPQTCESVTTEISRHIEDTITHDTKTLTLERTTPLPDIEMPSRIEQKEMKTIETQIVVPETEEGIQTSSISKQQSLNYFVNKMKEVDEFKPKEMTKPTPIKQDVYTKFEDIVQDKSYEKPLPKIEQLEMLPPLNIPIQMPDQQYSSYSSTQSNLYEEFNLTPEPPPEICYVSKPAESVKLHEDVTDKVKKIESLQRDLPEAEIPLGAVKIFPDIQPFKPTIYEEKSSSSFSKTEMFKSDKSMFYKAEAIGPVFRPLSPRPLPPMEFDTILPEKKHEIKKPEWEYNVSSSSSQHMKSTSTIFGSCLEPSPEAIAMEKAWAHKNAESNLHKSWPPTQIQTESAKIIPTWSNQSTMEKSWKPTSTEETVVKETSTPTSRTYIKETTSSSTSEYLPPPLAVPHYVAHVSHSSNIKEIAQAPNVQQQDFAYEKKEDMSMKQIKTAEVKSWPSKLESLPIRPISVQDISDEFSLEPGTPPEIVYAQPVQPIRPAVKIVPQEVKPVPIAPSAPSAPKKAIAPSVKHVAPLSPKKVFQPPSVEFEKFPELEPFPFRAEPERPKHMRIEPPPTPSKFIKGRFTDSDYESDFDAIRIPAKWKPHTSDTDEPSYRRVAAPKATFTSRARSCEKVAVAPSRFERAKPIVSSPRPVINFESMKLTKKQTVHFKKQTDSTKQVHEVKPTLTPPPPPPPQVIKQGSPPEYAYTEPKAPSSPKTKHKIIIDGYMADTDEPLRRTIKSEYRHEEKSMQSSQSYSEQMVSSPSKTPVASKLTPHKKHISSSASSKKKLVPTPIVSVSTTAPLEPFPFKPDPPVQKVRVPPPPSPSKFVKGEFRESDYESDYDGRFSSVLQHQEKQFKPVRPILTPTLKHQRKERSPTPPTEFDNPQRVEMPIKPKFEPIEKHKKTVKLEEIIKPIPKTRLATKYVIQPPASDVIIATPAIPAKVVIIQPGAPPEMVFTPGPRRTQYYQSTTSAPYHNAVQTETSNIMNFNESTENSHRTVSMQQTRKVIKFGDSSVRKTEQILEPFPFKPAENLTARQGSVPPLPKPSKFVPGDFRESDYENEVDAAKIQSKWGPTGEPPQPHYRSVRAPAFVRASSVPTSTERVITPMEFDIQPTFVPPFNVEKYKTSKRIGEDKSGHLINRNAAENITKTTATKIASQHMDSMTHSFKSKAQQFVADIMDDVNKKSTNVKKPILRSKDDSDAQVYREETRASNYGTKQVDPNTGLIYFKYDFGYEFGIVLPGDGNNGQIPMPTKTIIQPPQRSESIEMPVYHETTKPNVVTPQFQPKKFTSGACHKNIKWEPTSESEMSECEPDRQKKCWEQSSCSPISISPSLPSTSPAFNAYQGPGLQGTETPPSCEGTPAQSVGKRAPVFITPLRDIAVVCGQTARFECIVQSEPPPTILWSKNSRIIENSQDYQVFFRNGVCRLTIPKTYPEDAGTYTCTATNQIGAVCTTATLQVPGVPSHMYGTYRQFTTSGNLSPELYQRPASPNSATHATYVGKFNEAHDTNKSTKLL